MKVEKEEHFVGADGMVIIRLSKITPFSFNQITVQRATDSPISSPSIAGVRIELQPYKTPDDFFESLDNGDFVSIDSSPSTLVFNGVISAIRITPIDMDGSDKYLVNYLGGSPL